MSILLTTIGWLFSIYYVMIFFYILLSWLPHVQGSAVGVLLGRCVEPYIGIFRRFIPPIGVIDLSPIAAIIALRFLQEGVYVVLTWIYRYFSHQTFYFALHYFFS